MDNNASAVCNQDITLTNQNDGIESKFGEDIEVVENKVINSDGLTLVEVFQALVQVLDGDLALVKKVLAYANIMAKHGMKVAKESQLSRADVLRALEYKENIVISRQGFIKSPLSTSAVKSTKKKSKSRGFRWLIL